MSTHTFKHVHSHTNTHADAYTLTNLFHVSLLILVFFFSELRVTVYLNLEAGEQQRRHSLQNVHRHAHSQCYSETLR